MYMYITRIYACMLQRWFNTFYNGIWFIRRHRTSFYLLTTRGTLHFYKREYKHIYFCSNWEVLHTFLRRNISTHINVGVSIKCKAVALFHIPKTRLIPLYHSCRHSKCSDESVEWIKVTMNSSLCWKIKLYAEYTML